MADQVDRFARLLPTPAFILDADCGPGPDLKRFTSSGHVGRGIDLNPDFVTMATAHAQTSCADLRNVGSMFPAAHFDGVWCCAALVHLNEAHATDV
jgi:2-polyprenyl-3-methyl-5-hydroxy-6-metoxy-1,4-benzoquinol methylase